MAKKVEDYEKKLRAMIIERRQVNEVEPWLEAQIEAAAMNWQMMAKVHEEISKGQLLSYANGSSGQTKCIINPLLPMYKEMQRTHIMHLEALGLNFKTMPSKMTESATKGGDKHDPLMEYLASVNAYMNIPDDDK